MLRDANILFRSGSYASVVALTAFALEELGRSSILFDLRRQVIAGKILTRKEIQKQCNDHKTKQKRGLVTTTITDDIGLAEHLQTLSRAPPESAEWQNAEEKLNRMIELEEKRAPSERHEKRIAALYVELTSKGQWNRPVKIAPLDAHAFLRRAVGDYMLRYQQQYITPDGTLENIDPALYRALERWSDRPELPWPEWPTWPA